MSSSDLAILGGEPLFSEPRHVGTPFIPPRESVHSALDSILDTRRLSNDGPFVRRLERLLADHHGARHAVAMCNATLAMQVLYRALGLRGEIVMPAFTFIATAHAAAWEGLRPVFVDIDPSTHCIDPVVAAQAVGEETAALLGVHLWGRLCDVERLSIVARNAGVPLLFDAAQSLGVCRGDRFNGSIGLASVVSMHATKIVSGLEGGAVLTDDDALAEKLRLMRNFGFEGYDQVTSLGTNAKLDEFSAAFACEGLDALPGLLVRNEQIFDTYLESLHGLPGISLYNAAKADASNYHYVVAMIDPTTCPLGRDELLVAMHAENILARRYFFPGCHRMAPYAEETRNQGVSLPRTDAVAAAALVLPAGSAVSSDDVRLIGGRIRTAIDMHDRVRAKAGLATGA